MRQTMTDKLLSELNTLRGHSRRDIGYCYFANITGDGVSNRRSVYQVINAGGGVSYAYELNGPAVVRLRRIRAAIDAARLAIAKDAETAALDQRHPRNV